MLPIGSGRLAQALTFDVVRELTHEDVVRLVTLPVERSAPPMLQRIKAVHQTAARLLASGMSVTEVALRVGRTPQRIRDLQSDPTFAELLAYYENMRIDAEIEDGERLRTKLRHASEDAVDEIQHRLDDPEARKQIPVGELRQVAIMGADRTVAPPKTAVPTVITPQTITFNIDRPPRALVIDQPPAPALSKPDAKEDGK